MVFIIDSILSDIFILLVLDYESFFFNLFKLKIVVLDNGFLYQLSFVFMYIYVVDVDVNDNCLVFYFF